MAQAPKAFVDICLDIIKAKEDKDLEVIVETINALLDMEKISENQAGKLLEALKFRGKELATSPEGADELGVLQVVENL